MQDRLNRIWYGSSGWWWPLLPLSWLFRAIVWIRRTLYRTGLMRVTRLSVPVIVVGNITIGGTGKTPLVIWMVETLRARGWHPGVLSRGYGGSARQPTLVGADSVASEVGDEPLVLARRCACPVVVCPDRALGGTLLEQQSVDIIVTDDGLQHYALARDLELIVVDGARGLGNGHCLPAGPLREPSSRLRSVDAVVVNGEGWEWSGALRMTLQPRGVRAVESAETCQLADFSGRAVHAVAAIGHPERFFSMLRSAGLEVISHAHRDHEPLVASQVCFDDDLPVLMTEKDAVKCTGYADERHWYVPVNAYLNPTDTAKLESLIERRFATAVRQRDGAGGK